MNSAQGTFSTLSRLGYGYEREYEEYEYSIKSVSSNGGYEGKEDGGDF